MSIARTLWRTALAVWTTLNRPGALGRGTLGFNATTGHAEVHDGSNWRQLAFGDGDSFTGTLTLVNASDPTKFYSVRANAAGGLDFVRLDGTTMATLDFNGTLLLVGNSNVYGGGGNFLTQSGGNGASIPFMQVGVDAGSAAPAVDLLLAAKGAAGIKAQNAFGTKQVALTDATSIATDASAGNVFTVTLGGNRTLANPTNLVQGAQYVWRVTQDGTGSRTLAYGNLFKWSFGTAPVLTTTAGAVDIITAVYDGTSLLCGFMQDVR